MARPNKGQHKIPRTYLEAFTNSEGYVWVVDRKFHLYTQKPLHILTERDYYTIRFGKGGGTLNIETKFLGGIETNYAEIYKTKLEKQKSITQQEKASLAIFIASMMERQPMRRESLRKFFADVKEKVDHLRALPEAAKKRMSETILSSGGPSISADDLLEMGQDVGSLHSSLIPDNVVEIAPIIFDMKWCFMLRPTDSDPFITSDNPCIMMNPVTEAKYGRRTMGASPGLLQEDVEITLPLSSNIMLLCGWKMKNDCFYVDLQKDELISFSARTTRNASILISKSKKQLELKISNTKEAQAKKVSK